MASHLRVRRVKGYRNSLVFLEKRDIELISKVTYFTQGPQGTLASCLLAGSIPWSFFNAAQS